MSDEPTLSPRGAVFTVEMGMRPRTRFAVGAAEELAARLQQTTRLDEYRRLHGVYLRAAFDESNLRIAAVTGLKLGTIRNIHARYLKGGVAALRTRPKGGRWHAHLTVAEEEAVMHPFLEKAQAGGVVEISALKTAYEAKIGKAVPASTAYRVLHRHGWRKLAPRPRHPRADVAAQEAFKKTLPASSPQAAATPPSKANR